MTMIEPEPQSSTPVFEQAYEEPPKITWRSRLIGRPLPTADAPHQTIGKAVGLAVFASDALSSTAYATQEILVVLALAGTTAFGLAFPISLMIVTLLAIVAISYEQTIHAYPGGGGAYIVARDNLGIRPAQVAGAALLTDYILTVAVSISSGVNQITSAFNDLYPYRVPIAVVLVMFIMLVNLRGVRESGIAFSIPTYFFVAAMFITVGVGLFRYFSGSLGVVLDPPHMVHTAVSVLTPFLFLHAFANGTTALTGIEAISNGITAFKEPRSRNAGITLIWMAVILSSLFIGITFLAVQIGAVPSEEETVVSQLIRTVYGSRNFLYFITISATTVILIMAANTAFADFPRLSALVAADGFLPRQLTYRGSRLVYSYGIVALAGLASLLIIVFQASVSGLIPLYAIGVFLSFTLSQTGMTRRWLKSGRLVPGQEVKEHGSVLHYDPKWRLKMILNGFGAVCTAVVMLVFAYTKFAEGAWVVIIIIPTLVVMFYSIHRHYRVVANALSLEQYGEPLRTGRHRVVILIGGVHKGALKALNYGRSISHDVTAVHVSLDSEETKKIRQKWETWGQGTRLVVLDSPYRLLVEPVLEYISGLADRLQPNETITIIVPQFGPVKLTTRFLHTSTAEWLRKELLFKPGIVITEVPYTIDDSVELTKEQNS